MFRCVCTSSSVTLIMYAEVTKLQTYKINFAILSSAVFAIKNQRSFPKSNSLQWRTQEFCSWGGSTNSAKDRGQRERGSGGR